MHAAKKQIKSTNIHVTLELIFKFEEKYFEDILNERCICSKQFYSPELYVTSHYQEAKDYVAQLKRNILPLAIEVGKFRLCELCDLGEGINFLLCYTNYDDLVSISHEIFWCIDDQK